MKIDTLKLSHDLQTRAAVLDIIEHILIRNQNFDVAFDGEIKRYKDFDGRDRAFVRDMSMRILRCLGQIDFVLSKLSNRPLKDLKPKQVLTLLRIGAAQMLYMNVGDHAAVDTTVNLAKKMGFDQQKGFMNAILRNLGRDLDALKSEADKRIEKNTPKWLWREWVADYGGEATKEIAAMHLLQSPVDVTVKSNPEKWAKQLGGTVLPNGSVRLQKSGNVPDLDGFAEGEWWVQSAAASLPPALLGDVKGKKVVDLCAAPGGKTMQLAADGADVIAVDLSKNRLKRLNQNMHRCGLKAEVIAADGKSWQPDEPVDAVLVDAPCSATGTIRHQPDVLRLKSESDVRRLAETQKAMLNNAAKMLKDKGQLVYCTCSLQKSESEGVVEAFLSENKDFQRVPVKGDELFGWDEMITPEGDVRILPFHQKENGGMDGFFIARLIRSC
jgi:16S rRNA (cytosine967-C5)-methyltransferase